MVYALLAQGPPVVRLLRSVFFRQRPVARLQLLVVIPQPSDGLSGVLQFLLQTMRELIEPLQRKLDLRIQPVAATCQRCGGLCRLVRILTQRVHDLRQFAGGILTFQVFLHGRKSQHGIAIFRSCHHFSRWPVFVLKKSAFPHRLCQGKYEPGIFQITGLQGFVARLRDPVGKVNEDIRYLDGLGRGAVQLCMKNLFALRLGLGQTC